MSDRKSVLFFTNSDHGQANVVLAVVYELLRQNAVDVHIASWPSLEPRLKSLHRQVQDESQNESIAPIQYHNMALFPGFLEFVEKNKSRRKADVPHPPGRLGAERIALLKVRSLASWESQQYLSLFDWAFALTETVHSSIVVIDPFLVPVQDMAYHKKLNYAVLSPCTLADGLIPRQRWWSCLWKYPAFATGFPFPLPWSKIIDNLICYWTVKKCIWSDQVQAINQARYARGITTPLGSFTPWVEDIPHISPSLPEIDLPLRREPNVHNVGPILMASTSVSADQDLLLWLQKAPTVLIALGTHFEAYESTVREQAKGVLALLLARPDLQVLWKLKTESESGESGSNVAMSILKEQITWGRVRIEAWLKVDPISILQSGHVICFVHHGGANSYFEATWAGVPQVVIPMWYDTFDYATRVEYLGIGIYGNREAGNNCTFDKENYSAPLMIDGKEFGEAILQAVGKSRTEAEPLRRRAAALGSLCQRSGGRTEAARILIELCL